jgi:two-component system NtrC family sensor kinase
VQQVALNLVMNAAESSRAKGGGRVRVATRRSTDARGLVLEVADDGEGIPAERIHRIFDPFFTTKEDGKGLGLGLAVVYGIVESHGGTIDVSSEPGQGATFTVTLPLAGEVRTPLVTTADGAGETEATRG